MPYSQVPTSGQTLGNTHTPIFDNFNIINTAQSVNHVTYDDADQGKHKFLQMPEVGVASNPTTPTTGVDEAAFYSKVGTNPSETNLFFRAESLGFEYQLTKAISASTASFAVNSAYGTPPAGFTQTGGWSFLPGGLIFQYGLYSNATNIGTSGTISFPISFNNIPFSVQISLLRSDSSETIILDSGNLPTVTGFGFKASSSGGKGIYWIAIGS